MEAVDNTALDARPCMRGLGAVTNDCSAGVVLVRLELLPALNSLGVSCYVHVLKYLYRRRVGRLLN